MFYLILIILSELLFLYLFNYFIPKFKLMFLHFLRRVNIFLIHLKVYFPWFCFLLIDFSANYFLPLNLIILSKILKIVPLILAVQIQQYFEVYYFLFPNLEYFYLTIQFIEVVHFPFSNYFLILFLIVYFHFQAHFACLFFNFFFPNLLFL